MACATMLAWYIVICLHRSISQMCIKLAAVRYTDIQQIFENRRSLRFRSKSVHTYVAHHALSHTLKGCPVASSSLAARVENDDIRKIDDPFDLAQSRFRLWWPNYWMQREILIGHDSGHDLLAMCWFFSEIEGVVDFPNIVVFGSSGYTTGCNGKSF